MLTVYAIPVSLYCAKLRIVLRHKGLDWREVAPPGGYGSDAYKDIVPSGNLPALRDGPLLIADSEAIAEYLDEIRPDPPMLPGTAGDRARIRERSRFHDTRLEPELRALFPYLPGRPPASAELLDRQSRALTARLDQLADMLAATPDAGNRLTLAECGYPITFSWLSALRPRMGLDIEWPDAVDAYRRRTEALDAVAGELADYRPKLTAFLDG